MYFKNEIYLGSPTLHRKKYGNGCENFHPTPRNRKQSNILQNCTVRYGTYIKREKTFVMLESAAVSTQ